MTEPLTLNAPAHTGTTRAPSAPTLFIPPHSHMPHEFRDLDALCREVHRLRGRRGLRLAEAVVCVSGSSSFPGFDLYAIGEADQGEEWIGVAACQDTRRARFEAVLADVNPSKPRGMDARKGRLL